MTTFLFHGIITSQGKKRKLSVLDLLPRRHNAATRKEDKNAQKIFNFQGDYLANNLIFSAVRFTRITGKLLSRSTQTDPNATLTQSLFLAHSEVRFVITNNSTNVANNGTVKSNFSYFRLNNNTANAVSYTIRLYMISNKAYSGTETGTISCYIPIS